VGFWLLGSAASVFGIVVFGGLTRLTESGLSITEWKPLTGSLPPMSNADWELEFSKYQASPEFALLNPNISLEEFKKIYYMEWTHRVWGRLIGLTFVLPAAYFIARRRVTISMAWKLVGISGLIGFQGFLGWWMVKSGLRDDLFAPGSHPRVSQYRLAAHLGAAFTVYLAMLWSGLSVLRSHQPLSIKALARLSSPKLSLFRKCTALVGGLVFLTAMSGAFVAGLDAGLIYNEFPSMSGGTSSYRLTPPKSELFSEFYSRKADRSDIWWRNMLENPSLVQLDHRILAMSSLSAVLGLFAYGRYLKKPTLSRGAAKGLHGILGFVGLQVALGITTLLYLVPIPLAAAHQATSLALLSYIVVLGRRIWVPRSFIQAWKNVHSPSLKTSQGFRQWVSIFLHKLISVRNVIVDVFKVSKPRKRECIDQEEGSKLIFDQQGKANCWFYRGDGVMITCITALYQDYVNKRSPFKSKYRSALNLSKNRACRVLCEYRFFEAKFKSTAHSVVRKDFIYGLIQMLAGLLAVSIKTHESPQQE
jgi:cytochrome c oxidase assembly protein subunit 15